MKMGSATFWGIVLILIGLSFVIKVIFNIDIHLFKILLAFFLIYVGIRLISGNFKLMGPRVSEYEIIFGEGQFKGPFKNMDKYNVIFGKSTIDLRNWNSMEPGTHRVYLKNVFASTEILIEQGTSVRVLTEAAFSGIQYPDGNSSSFGNSQYSNNANSDTILIIEANVVFGSLQVKKY